MSKEPTRRELKAAIDKNSAGIAKNSEAIAENREAIAENRKAIGENREAIRVLDGKVDRLSNTMGNMFEVINENFERMYQKFDDFSAWAKESDRSFKLIFDGQNENRYRLDGHDSEFSAVKSRVTELEHKAS